MSFVRFEMWIFSEIPDKIFMSHFQSQYEKHKYRTHIYLVRSMGYSIVWIDNIDF